MLTVFAFNGELEETVATAQTETELRKGLEGVVPTRAIEPLLANQRWEDPAEDDCGYILVEHEPGEDALYLSDRVLLHVSDWNSQDKFYEMDAATLKEWRTLHESEADTKVLWRWFIARKDENKIVRCDEAADHTLDEFFWDYMFPHECAKDWEELNEYGRDENHPVG
jgi:hypothetical protein